MINVKSLINLLKKNKINFYTGVPDSILKEFSLSIKNKKKHLIAVNEGAAVSIGIGNYLSSGKIPCVYMQNSGLSNAINPLISISGKKVYSIPLILIIGWRGAPGSNDEPQHNAKGNITKQILKLLNIKYTVVNSSEDLKKFDKQIKYAKKNHTTVACLIKKNTFKKSINSVTKNFYKLEKGFFLKNLLQNLPNKSKIISSTGYNSREIIFLRQKYKLTDSSDFYMVGGMGHTTSVALGYSLSTKNMTFCIDGDGSLLMHLGSIMTVGNFAPKNFKYILLNNNSHDSVGGQITYADNINFKKLSHSLGFKKFFLIKSKKNLLKKIKSFVNLNSTGFLEVRILNNKNKNLPRPNNLIEIKNQFMKNL